MPTQRHPKVTPGIRAQVDILAVRVAETKRQCRIPGGFEHEYMVFMRGAFRNRAARSRRIEAAMQTWDFTGLDLGAFPEDTCDANGIPIDNRRVPRDD